MMAQSPSNILKNISTNTATILVFSAQIEKELVIARSRLKDGIARKDVYSEVVKLKAAEPGAKKAREAH